MDDILKFIKRFIPRKLFNMLAPAYHYALAMGGAILYRFPSKELIVIAVTGTKGKSSTTEIINSIFEAAGHRTMLLNTIHWKIDEHWVANNRKMTIPGRFFIQRMLRKGLNAGCSVAILEMSSEAAKQYRHKYVYLDALIFTNLSPEHIESHGSYENYRSAKLALTETLKKRLKKHSIMVANADDPESHHFLNSGAETSIPFSLEDGEPYEVKTDGISLTWRGTRINSPLRGIFNIYNCISAAACAEAFGISKEAIKEGIEKLSLIRGRVEFVKFDSNNPLQSKQNFDVVIDYAHTAGSLTELYKVFKDKHIIAVLGNTGGGRDKWKRPEMARVADTFAHDIILTNEDPYDEDPDQIISDMLPGFKIHTPDIIMDRREAIHQAIYKASLKQAEGDQNVAVLITGKGTDPYIMLAGNQKLAWSDYLVAQEELEKVLSNA